MESQISVLFLKYWRLQYLIDQEFYSLAEMLRSKGYDCPEFDGGLMLARQIIEVDKKYYQDIFHRPHPEWRYGFAFDNLLWTYNENSSEIISSTISLVDIAEGPYDKSTLGQALLKARSARFEFTQK